MEGGGPEGNSSVDSSLANVDRVLTRRERERLNEAVVTVAPILSHGDSWYDGSERLSLMVAVPFWVSPAHIIKQSESVCGELVVGDIVNSDSEPVCEEIVAKSG